MKLKRILTPEKALKTNSDNAYQYGWRDGFEAAKSAARIQAHLDAAKKCDETYDILNIAEKDEALKVMESKP